MKLVLVKILGLKKQKKIHKRILLEKLKVQLLIRVLLIKFKFFFYAITCFKKKICDCVLCGNEVILKFKKKKKEHI